MRKEVKLGFAVGGVLLSVLVVYVLVMTGQKAAPPEVTLATNDAAAASLPQPDLAPPPPRPEPARIEPIASETSPAPTTLPAPAQATAAASAPPADDKWIVLHTGLVSNTQAPESPEPVPSFVPLVDTAVTPPTTPMPDVAPASPISTPPATIPPSVSASGNPRTHMIAPGETFSSIAAAVYGNSSYYAHLIRANPGIDPAKLKPGMTIKLPPEGEVRVTSPSGQPVQAAQPLDEKSEYRIQNGDSLYKISVKLYGKPDRIDKIYELNKTMIGADKAKLKVGSVLKLPEAPTQKTP